MRYYSTEHCLFPGNYPDEGVVHIKNYYDFPVAFRGVEKPVWGYIDYDRELTKEEAEEWELTPSPFKRYWGVVTIFYDSEAMTALKKEIIGVSDMKKPKNFHSAKKHMKISVHWFDSRKEAEEFQSFGCWKE